MYNMNSDVNSIYKRLGTFNCLADGEIEMQKYSCAWPIGIK